MAGELAIVLVTPFVNLSGEILREQFAHHAPIAIAQPVRFFALDKQRAQILQQILAITSPVSGEHHGRIGGVPAEILRLVRKEAGHVFAEVLAEALIVLFMGFPDELVHDVGVQNVHHGGIGAVVQAIAGLAVVLENPQDVSRRQAIAGQGLGIEGRLFFAGEIMGKVRRVFQQLHSGKAAGPAVFIVAPGVHVLLFGLVDAGFHRFHPVLAHVFGKQAAPGMHEKSADTGLFHVPNLPAELFGLQLIVPAPKGNGLIILQFLFGNHKAFPPFVHAKAHSVALL